MLKGVHLTLLIGPGVPVPVPRPVIEALESVKVNVNTDEPSGFDLNFTISSKSVLNTLLLLLPRVGPFVRTIIIATVNGIPNVLIDGVITNQQISPDAQAGKSTVTLRGTDLTAVMNFIDATGFPHPAMSAEAIVAFILARYAFFGIVPLVIPSPFVDVPIPIDRIPVQKGKDLEYINILAEEVGHKFYINSGPAPGTNIAYWGPEIKSGPPQPALNINMDAHTNIESLSFSFSGEERILPIVFIHLKETKLSIPIPIPSDVSVLNPPLAALPPTPSKIEFLKWTAKLSPAKALSVGLAHAASSSDAVQGTGKLDVLRYGRALKARGLVGVRGAGMAFDGLYYVKSVTHEIKRGEYKQSFTLTRNGLISLTPRVPA